MHKIVLGVLCALLTAHLYVPAQQLERAIAASDFKKAYVTIPKLLMRSAAESERLALCAQNASARAKHELSCPLHAGEIGRLLFGAGLTAAGTLFAAHAIDFLDWEKIGELPHEAATLGLISLASIWYGTRCMYRTLTKQDRMRKYADALAIERLLTEK